MNKVKFPNTYIAFDLETSGLDPKKDKILEIGCMGVKDGKITGSQSWILKHEGLVISPEITAINGIDQAIVDKEGVNPKQAMEEFLRIFNSYSAHLTHNGIRFDIPFLAEQAQQIIGWNYAEMVDFTNGANKNAIDTAALYKGAFVLETERMWNESFHDFAIRVMNVIQRGKYNVGHCCDELGIDRTQVTQHRALGDIALTHQIYQKLTQV